MLESLNGEFKLYRLAAINRRQKDHLPQDQTTLDVGELVEEGGLGQVLRSLKRFGLKSFAIIAFSAIILGSVSCSPKTYSGRVESITVAYSPYVETSFYWIAEDQHYFSQNGLNVTFVKYGSLVPAVDAMLKGEVNIVGNVTEFPVVNRALQNANIIAISCIARSETTFLVGRKDLGIEQVSDLKGKRVGTLQGTITDFYIGKLFELNGMSLKDLTLVDVKTPDGAVNALANGDVDAVVVGQPYANSARDQLGANAFVQSAQSNQPLYALAVSTDGWITNHPELVVRFLKSLEQAEQYLTRNPAEAKVIVQRRLGLDDAAIGAFWPQIQFGLSLDQSLLVAMEAESRWEISNNLTNAKDIPDFLQYIYLDGLQKVEPAAVNIIH